MDRWVALDEGMGEPMTDGHTSERKDRRTNFLVDEWIDSYMRRWIRMNRRIDAWMNAYTELRINFEYQSGCVAVIAGSSHWCYRGCERIP